MKFRLPVVVAVLATIAVPASADTTIKTRNNFGNDASTDTIYIKNDRMRVDSGRDDSYMIFNAADHTMTVVEPAEQRYMVMTEENLRAMGDAVSQAMKQMEQQLQNMPPQQREQMRRMMEQQMGGMMGNAGGEKPKPEIVRTGESRTVAGHDCNVVRILLDGKPSGSACMAEYGDLGIPEQDRATIESLMEFSMSLTERFGDMMPAHMKAMAAEGYPVQYESSVGSTNVSGQLESVETGALAGDLFSVPAGYSERAMPSMPGG